MIFAVSFGVLLKVWFKSFLSARQKKMIREGVGSQGDIEASVTTYSPDSQCLQHNTSWLLRSSKVLQGLQSPNCPVAGVSEASPLLSAAQIVYYSQHDFTGLSTVSTNFIFRASDAQATAPSEDRQHTIASFYQQLPVASEYALDTTSQSAEGASATQNPASSLNVKAELYVQNLYVCLI